MNAFHHLVVIGASAGGLSVIRTLLAGLPKDTAATIVVVQHQLPEPNHLAQLLGSSSTLPVDLVEEAAPLSPGRVLIAAPDTHLVITPDRAVATRGPRENRARPSINVAFRSAAAAYPGRVVAILLSGLLDDGVAGLDAVGRCGGTVVVQDPRDAECPDLPRNALAAVQVDHVLAIPEIASRLPDWIAAPAVDATVPEDVRIEASLNGPTESRPTAVESIGDPAPLACPECEGPMWRNRSGRTRMFRCHVGHAYSLRALLDGQNIAVEQALWAAVRTLTERARVVRELGDDSSGAVSSLARIYRDRAAEDESHADALRSLLFAMKSAPTSAPNADQPRS